VVLGAMRRVMRIAMIVVPCHGRKAFEATDVRPSGLRSQGLRGPSGVRAAKF